MKKTLYVIFILISIPYTVINAQINLQDSTVQFVAYYSIGDKYEYSYENNAFSIVNNDTILNQSSRCDLEIAVIDSTEHSYTMQCKYSNCRLNYYNDSITNKILNEMYNLLGDYEVIYETDEYGTFIKIKNWEEIRDKINPICDSVVKKLYTEFPMINFGFTENALAEHLKQPFSSGEKLETSCNEIKLLHSLLGSKMKIGNTYQADGETSNIWGGTPMKTTTLYTIENVDTENEITQVYSEMTTDASEIMKSFKESLSQKAINKQTQSEIENIKIPDLSVSTYTTFNIHSSGWTTYCFSVSDVKTTHTESFSTSEIIMK
ncbi:hypothetical protein [Coprobacter tertius]|uniref:Uncharacterized protein n=1 Tax=Coprobacter tertius TaxID=2944915 RepID=A0ABT1MK42_9BACT|nr:hypothetical protein [Coprobacter tertius]MCP9612982.1 hypothetical protein [Coprobacter tertius]